jgi:hypothetical protein
MSNESSKNAPEVYASNEKLDLNVREAKIFLDTNSGVGADTNVETQIARVDSGTHGIDVCRTGDGYLPCAMVSMMLSRMAQKIFWVRIHGFKVWRIGHVVSRESA